VEKHPLIFGFEKRVLLLSQLFWQNSQISRSGDPVKNMNGFDFCEQTLADSRLWIFGFMNLQKNLLSFWVF
jgi:hypothetical protein